MKNVFQSMYLPNQYLMVSLASISIAAIFDTGIWMGKNRLFLKDGIFGKKSFILFLHNEKSCDENININWQQMLLHLYLLYIVIKICPVSWFINSCAREKVLVSDTCTGARTLSDTKLIIIAWTCYSHKQNVISGK